MTFVWGMLAGALGLFAFLLVLGTVLNRKDRTDPPPSPRTQEYLEWLEHSWEPPP